MPHSGIVAGEEEEREGLFRLVCARYGSMNAVSLDSQTVDSRTRPKSWTVFFGALALLVLLALEIVILFSFVESEVNPSQ